MHFTDELLLLMLLNQILKCQTNCTFTLNLTSASVNKIQGSTAKFWVFFLNPNLDLSVESGFPWLCFEGRSKCKKSKRRKQQNANQHAFGTP